MPWWPGPEVRVRVSTYGAFALLSFVVVGVLFGDPQRKLGAFIWDWQTLIGGGLAVVAAYISLRGPREQLKQAERLNTEALKREENAARGLLSLALNSITLYARACSAATENLYEETGTASNPIELPPFDRGNLLLVRDAIRYAPQPYQNRMLALLPAIQVMEANAVSDTLTVPEHHLFERCANVEYLCEILFDYARGRDDSFPEDAPTYIPPDRLWRQAIFSEKGQSFWPNLEETIKLREKHGSRDA